MQAKSRMQAPSPPEPQVPSTDATSQRIDQWLWCARFYRSRSMAADAVELGRVTVNRERVKPAKAVRTGDEVAVQRPGEAAPCVVLVRALAAARGGAPVAAGLYEETASSKAAREQARMARKLSPEPALSMPHGRPTKQERRAIEQVRARWVRWSAAVDEES